MVVRSYDRHGNLLRVEPYVLPPGAKRVMWPNGKRAIQFGEPDPTP